MRVAGVILAGACRPGGQGAMRRIEPVAAILRPQVAVLAVVMTGPPGAVAPRQVLTALTWAAAEGCSHCLVVPALGPALPADLVAQLGAAARRHEAGVACAAAGPDVRFAVALWAVRLRWAVRWRLWRQPMERLDGLVTRCRWTAVPCLPVTQDRQRPPLPGGPPSAAGPGPTLAAPEPGRG